MCMYRVGRESSSRTKELFNIPFLVLKARQAPTCKWLCLGNFQRMEVLEQALGGISLGFGIDKPYEL